MKIKFWSDAHTEFWTYHNPSKFQRILETYLPPNKADKDTVLCCSGDMGTYGSYASTYKPLFDLLAKRFKHVICVPGNHSWYNSTGIWGNEAEFWQDKNLPDNVHYLDNNVFLLDGVAFIGSCLWTDFQQRNQSAMFLAERGMNDFRIIKLQNTDCYASDYGSRLTAEATVVRHETSLVFIQDALKVYADRSRVVVTHHAPSSSSVASMYQGDALNAAYHSDLNALIEDTAPTVWTHGHMHDSKDYMIGNTRILCNPLGYHPQQLNRKFNPGLVIEI